MCNNNTLKEIYRMCNFRQYKGLSAPMVEVSNFFRFLIEDIFSTLLISVCWIFFLNRVCYIDFLKKPLSTILMNLLSLLLTAIVAITAPRLTQTQDNLDEGLVAYYPFSGNANDESGNGHHGTVHGASLTADRFENAESAYYFDGNDHIDISELTNSISKRRQLSLSAWVNPYNYNNYYPHLLGSESNVISFHGQGSVYKIHQGKIGFYVGCSSRSRNGNRCVMTSRIPVRQWSHVTATYDAEAQLTSIYQDGMLREAVSVCSGESIPKFSLLAIGGGCGLKDSCYWQGSIDEFRIYDRLLNTTEVKILAGSYKAEEADVNQKTTQQCQKDIAQLQEEKKQLREQIESNNSTAEKKIEKLEDSITHLEGLIKNLTKNLDQLPEKEKSTFAFIYKVSASILHYWEFMKPLVSTDKMLIILILGYVPLLWAMKHSKQNEEEQAKISSMTQKLSLKSVRREIRKQERKMTPEDKEKLNAVRKRKAWISESELTENF